MSNLYRIRNTNKVLIHSQVFESRKLDFFFFVLEREKNKNVLVPARIRKNKSSYLFSNL